jgi:hypothetical protein
MENSGAGGSYQNIAGATAATYLVKEADEGFKIEVVATATNGNGATVSQTSAATIAVTDTTPTATVTGSAHSTGRITGSVTDNLTGTVTVSIFYNGTFHDSFNVSVTANIAAPWTDTGSNKPTAGTIITAQASDTAGNVGPVSPGFTTTAPAGVAGAPINLALPDPLGVGKLTTVTISGMPSDWSLNEGTNLGDGTWTLQTNDLSALTVSTAAAYSGAMVLHVTESWTNADGSTSTITVADNLEAYAPATPIFALPGKDTLTGAGANKRVRLRAPDQQRHNL